MNIKEAWAFGRSELSHSASPALDARLLLEHLLGVSHSFLITHEEEPLTADQEGDYLALIERARQKEPIPYLRGSMPFCGLDFHVGPGVLIPRPETEQLVEMALKWAEHRQPLRLVDVGTGSGCIAICLARKLAQASVDAVDISGQALNVARLNAKALAPDRVRFHQGDLLAPISNPVDLIIANLPYITEGEWTAIDDGVKLYEPAIALRGGEDGLDLIRQLLQQARSKLNPGGAIFLEIGWRQGALARTVAQSCFPAGRVTVSSDFAGNDRIVTIITV